MAMYYISDPIWSDYIYSGSLQAFTQELYYSITTCMVITLIDEIHISIDYQIKGFHKNGFMG